MAGRLVVLDGIDAAGKDTQVSKLRSLLEEKRQSVEVLHLPDTSGPIGKVIQGFLKKEYDLAPDVQFLLYAVDILQKAGEIRKCLDAGATVICNRYLTSTLAYQGAQGFPLGKALAFIKLFDFPMPDIIIFLKISPATSVRRKINQKQMLDRFESKEAFQTRVAEAYEGLIRESVLGSWVVVDGEQQQDEVFADITKALS